MPSTPPARGTSSRSPCRGGSRPAVAPRPAATTSPPTEDPEGLLPLIRQNGDVTVVYDGVESGGDFEVAQTSTDGGSTWSAPVHIAEFLGAGDPGLRTGGLPAAAIDPTTD